MAEDDRREGAGREHEAGGPGAAPRDAVALPEHASAYFSPRPPPASTEHSTLELARVRLDPAVDPINATTQRVSVDGLQPPPWLGNGPRSDAPTVLVPIVRARRRRRRLIVVSIAALVGAAGGALYGLASRSDALQEGAASVSPSQPLIASRGPAPPPSTEVPRVVVPEPTALEALPRLSAEPQQGPAHSAPSSASAPRARAALSPRPSPASSAPSAWLRPEAPKPWLR